MILKLSKVRQWLGLCFIILGLTITIHHIPLAGATLPSQTIPNSYKEIQYPPLPEVDLPKYERYQLANGIIVYLMEDHRFPLVSGSAIAPVGSRLDPNSQVGLTDLTIDLIRLGGTASHSPQALNGILEQKAASIETSNDRTSANINFSGLSYDLDTIFPLFAEVLKSPAFDSQQLEIRKIQYRGQIARRNDNPGNIARREFSKLIYGNDSPYARTIENETLDNIKVENLKEFYDQYIQPEGLILGILGDFDSEKMKAKIQREFGNWDKKPSRAINIDVNPPQQVNTSGVFIISQPQLTQSNILLGHLGGRINDEDYPTLTVINGILNGYGGRLHNEIRTRQGLAYSVYGIWRSQYDYDGVFLAGGQTRSETTGQFIESLKREIEDLRTNSVTQEELNYAKDSMLNSFVFQFQSPSQTLSRIMTYEFYDYPSDFIFQYQKKVKSTTRDDVLKVAQKSLKPDKIVTLIVGNEEQIKPTLEGLNGQISTLNL